MMLADLRVHQHVDPITASDMTILDLFKQVNLFKFEHYKETYLN